MEILWTSRIGVPTVKASGIKWSAVGPNSFLENFHGFAGFYKGGTVYGASTPGDTPCCVECHIAASLRLSSRLRRKFESHVCTRTGGTRYSDADLVAALNKHFGQVW